MKAIGRINRSRFALVAACVLLGLWVADEYPALRFRGDAKFSGGPVFGYRISMRPIPFYVPGEYVFHLRGLPKENMSLQLYADGKTDRDREELVHLNTTLEAELIDHGGGAVCQATGVPHDGQVENNWVVMSSPYEAAFWHQRCIDVPVNPSDSYTLTLRVSSVDPRTPKINLLPILEGGQLDLP